MTTSQRRLAAIVAMDVAGYSRLMGRDEQGTLKRLTEHRKVIDPISVEHGGRIVGTAGDGILIEFPSVVEAVNFALRCQAVMAERNADISDDDKMLFRIGINLGDVLVQDNDIFGDGVNVAARIEALADPGGICVSRTVRDNVRDKLDIKLEDQGEVEVKNIARPVRVFRVTASREFIGAIKPSGNVAPVQKSHARSSRTKIFTAMAALVLIALVAGSGYYWRLATEFDPEVDPILALPNGPKIVVLPFENLSGDQEQDYFIDGLTDDLAVRLARYPYLFVIARESAFQYKNQSINIREVQKNLGVDYVLTGSVRKSTDNIRVNAQLYDAKVGSSIWAQSYDKKLSVLNIFEIQDELTTLVEAELAGDVAGGTIYQRAVEGIELKHPESLEAYECVLLASHYWVTMDPNVHARSRDCLETVTLEYPNHAVAWTKLAWMYYSEHANFANPRPSPLQRAIQAAERAIEINSGNGEAYQVLAWLRFFSREKDKALLAIERALELNPNIADTLNAGANILFRFDQWERGKKLNEKAFKLNPNPPWYYHNVDYLYYFAKKDYENALKSALKTHVPWWHWKPGSEAIALASLGRLDEARSTVDKALKLKPDFAETAMDELEFWWWSQPELIERSVNALRKAGLNIPES